MPDTERRNAAARVVAAADYAGTFVFAIEGAMAAEAAGLDPVGVLVLAFLTALGGGVIRDILIGTVPPAAILDWRYAAITLAASGLVMAWDISALPLPPFLFITLDAAGLALFAVAGTQKALHLGIHRLPSIFLGAIGGVGGGALRDLMLNHTPRVLVADIYATAALLGAAVVVLCVGMGMRQPRAAWIGGVACFALRLLAASQGWHLPRP